jgi:hypothetical protein
MKNEELKNKAYLIAHNHVHGLTDALTDSQEKKDLTKEILQFAELYHQSKVNVDLADVSKSVCKLCKDLEVIHKEGLCMICYDDVHGM